MQHTLIAVFDNRTDAQAALDELLASGFSRDEVRLSEADPTGMTSSLTGSSDSATQSSDDGSFGSSIKHFFSNLFGTDTNAHAEKYSTAVTRGHHVLTLTAASEPEVERGADIVERHGPVDIDEKAAGWSGVQTDSMRGRSGLQQQSSLTSQQSGLQGSQQLDQGSLQGSSLQGSSMQDSTLAGSNLQDSTLQGSAMQGSQQRAATTGEGTAIPVIQEELRVGKREVQRGGVRIFQRMVETPVNETVNLREEHVNVERRPVDQPISSADLAGFEEKSIELRETAEEAVVQKSARVVEEVVVGKEVSEREQQINDTVRHTEVDIEQLGAGAVSSTSGTGGTSGLSGTGTTGSGNTMGGSSTLGGTDALGGSGTLGGTGTMGDSSALGGSSTMGGSGTIGSSTSLGGTGTMGGTDDSYFRNHWNSNYASQGGNYDEYAPAYSYGSSMAGTDQYRGRQWNDVESNMRTDWESRNPGSAWDKVKAAVRHGWEKVTS
jgi:uncharacterized protein (TIGR02271 family)